MHVVIHIGPPKTGTSSIQMASQLNREYLEEHGIFVYRAKKLTSRALALTFMDAGRSNKPDIRRHFASAEEAKAWSESRWSEFETQVAAQRPPVTFISSEMFANLRDPSVFLARLQGMFDRLTVVAYVRDPVELYESQIDTFIQAGARFRDLQTPLEYEYPGKWRIQNYVDKLGRDNVIVRNFARSNLRGGDVVTDFFETMSDITESRLELPVIPKRANESLAAAATAWMMTINETFDMAAPSNTRENLQGRFDLLERLRGTPSLVDLPRLKLHDPEARALIRHNARNVCQWYNSTFLEGQEPLEVGEKLSALPDPEFVRENMLSWLLSYLTSDAVARVSRAIFRES